MIGSRRIKKDQHKDKEYNLFIMIDKENIQNSMEDKYSVMIVIEK
jgi:hypothetical protein